MGSTTDNPTATLHAVLFYTDGQSLAGECADEQLIVQALRDAGLATWVVDLADVRRAADGSLEVLDPEHGRHVPWRDPHAALMYHGAIAPDDAVELLRAMEARGTVVVNGADAWPVFTDKLWFARYMQERDVRVIPSRPVTGGPELRAAVDQLGGSAVVKKAISTEGMDVHVVRGADDLDGVVALVAASDECYLVQPIVDSTARELEPGIAACLLPGESGRRHEFRINTARMHDGEIRVTAAYMRIARTADQVVNNVAQGARPIRIEFTDLHPTDQETMLRAAACSPPGGDLVGWDLIGQPGERMVIEGNSGSGLPNGTEGIDPRTVVPTYGELMRAAALRSTVQAPA